MYYVLICILFNASFVALIDRMIVNEELEGMWKEAVMA
jgi:hypothetical protein